MTVTNDQAKLFHADFPTFFGLSSHQKDKNVPKKEKKAICCKCNDFPWQEPIKFSNLNQHRRVYTTFRNDQKRRSPL